MNAHVIRLVFTFAIVLAGCDDGIGPEAEAASLEVRPGFVRTVAGSGIDFEARLFDASGNPVAEPGVAWESLDPHIVALEDASALALTPGWARVVATEPEASLADTALVAVGIPFASVTSGDDYSCGWTESGAGWCWGTAHEGSFYEGVLGAGTDAGSPTPVAVAGGLTFTQIDAGETHTCGVADGSVYCWGYDRGGALGFNGCGSNSCDEPVAMEIAGAFTDVSVPAWWDRTTCATGPAGLHCWGSTSYGALGIFPLPCSPTCDPQLVSTTLTRDVSMGRQHGCALDADGVAHCWGDDQFGQLGIGAAEASHTCGFSSTPCAATPTAVATAQRFVQLESGSYFTCGRTADGRVFCWGEYDSFASVSSTSNEPGRSAVEVSGDLRFTTIGAGWFHACGVVSTGELYCWGRAAWNYAMGLPVGEYFTISEPRLIDAGGALFTAVDVGPQHTCAVATDSSVRCMGSGWALGQGTYWLERARPIAIAPPGPLPAELDLMP